MKPWRVHRFSQWMTVHPSSPSIHPCIHPSVHHPSIHVIIFFFFTKNVQCTSFHAEPWFIKVKSEWRVAIESLKCGQFELRYAVSVKYSSDFKGFIGKKMSNIFLINVVFLTYEVVIFWLYGVKWNVLLKVISPAFFLLSENVASASKWQITFMACVIFLLGSTALEACCLVGVARYTPMCPSLVRHHSPSTPPFLLCLASPSLGLAHFSLMEAVLTHICGGQIHFFVALLWSGPGGLVTVDQLLLPSFFLSPSGPSSQVLPCLLFSSHLINVRALQSLVFSRHHLLRAHGLHSVYTCWASALSM